MFSYVEAFHDGLGRSKQVLSDAYLTILYFQGQISAFLQ